MHNPVARIYVNDVEVGSLPVTQYRNIVEELRRDRKLYLAQAFNLIGSLWRGAVMMLRVLPMFWLLLLIVVVLFDPESMTWILAEIVKAKPAEITNAMRVAILVSIGFTMFTFLVSSVFLGSSSYRFGYVNQFDNAINKRIRSLLEVPTEGNMQVVVVDGDGNHGK